MERKTPGCDLIMAEFTLKITLGNEAMQTNFDVAELLKEVSIDIENNGLDYGGKKLRDINGNTVGSWRVK
jgi:hypothetical protein